MKRWHEWFRKVISLILLVEGVRVNSDCSIGEERMFARFEMTSNDCSTLCTKCTSTCGPRIGVWWASFEEFTALCNRESAIVRKKALIPNYVVQGSRMNTPAGVTVTPSSEKGFVLRCEIVGVCNSVTIAVTSNRLDFFTHFPVSSMDVDCLLQL